MPRAKKPKKIKRRRLMLTPNDFRAMDFLVTKKAQPSRTQALRYALAGQEQRDSPTGTVLPKDRERIRLGVTDYASKSQKNGPEELRLINWSTPLTDADFAIVRAVQRRWKLKAWSEALRLALRFQAEQDGFRPLGGIW